MRFLDYLGISGKLWLMVSLPLGALFYFSSLTLLEQGGMSESIDDSLRLTRLMLTLGKLSSDIEQEHSESCLYHEGSEYSLEARYRQTDADIQQLLQQLKGAQGILYEREARRLESNLQQLSRLRAQIEQESLSCDEIDTVYGAIYGRIFEEVEAIPHRVDDPMLAESMNAYARALRQYPFSGAENGLYPPLSEVVEQLGKMLADQEQQQRSLHQQQNRLHFLLLFLVVVSTLGLVAYLHQRWNRLLGQVREQILRLLDGEDLSLRTGLRERGEVGQMADAVDALMERYQRVVTRSAKLQRSRNQLAREKDYVYDMIAAMVNPMVMVNGEGMILESNPAMSELVGWEMDRLVGRPLALLFAGEENEAGVTQILERFLQQSRAEQSISFEEEHAEYRVLLHRDGERIPVELLGAPIYGGGKRRSLEQRIELIFHDLRKRVKEEQLACDAAYRGGMAEISSEFLHNFGNGLSVLKLYLGEQVLLERFMKQMEGVLLLCDEASQSGKESTFTLQQIAEAMRYSRKQYLDGNLESATLAVNHLTGILDSQRVLVGGGQGYWISRFDLVLALNEVQTLLQDRLSHSGIAYSAVLEEVTEVYLPKNPMQQMLLSLVQYAIESIDERVRIGGLTAGKGAISVRVESLGQRWFTITLEDNGMGFLPEDAHKLFVQDYRLKVAQIGQGLHAAANFVNAMRGTITSHSEGRGQGERFEITLPLQMVGDDSVDTGAAVMDAP